MCFWVEVYMFFVLHKLLWHKYYFLCICRPRKKGVRHSPTFPYRCVPRRAKGLVNTFVTKVLSLLPVSAQGWFHGTPLRKPLSQRNFAISPFEVWRAQKERGCFSLGNLLSAQFITQTKARPLFLCPPYFKKAYEICTIYVWTIKNHNSAFFWNVPFQNVGQITDFYFAPFWILAKIWKTTFLKYFFLMKFGSK